MKHLEVSTSHACFNPVSTHKKVPEKLNFREQCVKFQECFQSWFISEAGGSFFLNLMQLKGKGGRFKMTLPETDVRSPLKISPPNNRLPSIHFQVQTCCWFQGGLYTFFDSTFQDPHFFGRHVTRHERMNPIFTGKP